MRRFLLQIFALALITTCALEAQSTQSGAISEALTALQRGDLPTAERVLHAQLQVNPNDVTALGVLAVVLDQEKRYADADKAYRHAIAVSSPSAELLNNFGNHLMVTGKLEEARAVFVKVLGLRPGQENATVQLAQIAVRRNAGEEALKYLDRLAVSRQTSSEINILRMQADYELGRGAEAEEALKRLSVLAATDARLSFSMGVALAAVHQYEKAETFLNRTVEAAPENFEALYDLGLAASHAGHKERAREVLQQALNKEPDNVDVLYDLAVVDSELSHKDVALELLARAARLAPERADVQLPIAHDSADLGYFGDAVEAWNKYMRLAPGNDVGRREHAFAEIALGENVDASMADLKWFVRKHPNDAGGHYELGIAEGVSNPDAAIEELNRALTLKPDLTAALMARGILNYRRGQIAAALPDFELAAKREPTNAAVLDRLGQTYIALGKSGDAVEVLRKANQLAPRDSTILLHLGRALTNTGQSDEAKAVFQRFRELGPNRSGLPHPAGLVDFLSLPPDEQFARYRAGVERTVQRHPENAEAQVRYLEILLNDGKTSEAAAVAQTILALKPGSALLAEAAHAMLGAENYSLANNFLDHAIALVGASADLEADKRVAASHLTH